VLVNGIARQENRFTVVGRRRLRRYIFVFLGQRWRFCPFFVPLRDVRLSQQLVVPLFEFRNEAGEKRPGRFKDVLRYVERFREASGGAGHLPRAACSAGPHHPDPSEARRQPDEDAQRTANQKTAQVAAGGHFPEQDVAELPFGLK
jgi:hypothetical protein